MSESLDSDRLNRYLLGLMSEKEQTELEEVYLTDDVLNDELKAAERELMDRYVEGSLSKPERDRFERFFLCSPGRIERLGFAKALRAYGSKLDASASTVTRTSRSAPFGMLNAFVRSYTGIAASAVLLIALGAVSWRVFLYRSPEQQVLSALTKVNSTGRLFESRITGLNYAPMAQPRGDGQPTLDPLHLREAEFIALKQKDDHPGANAFHSLGRVFLVEQNFELAL
ncbi:MAG TPA: hypothetical protein VFV34_29600, partial [Blastocatellia bacterium]|nr:hypothetical protein [Blastocatellia bacterium]